MKDYQREFLEFALATGALRFGEFTLKSGRRSPYFFNTGMFNTGGSLARLGQFYARAIGEQGCRFDMLYGPAYKGIPLVAAVAIALAEHHGRDVPYAFNRKEAKRHGEGGILVGAPVAGEVLIVDDVISAGLSVGESVDLIRGAGGRAAGVLISLDRQERGIDGGISAVRQVEQKYRIPVYSIATLRNLMEFLQGRHGAVAQLDAVRAYCERYGSQ